MLPEMNTPLDFVILPVRDFGDVSLDWESYNSDTRCVAWVLYSTDNDVILPAARFPVDVNWCPEIVGAVALCPRGHFSSIRWMCEFDQDGTSLDTRHSVAH